MRVVRRLRGSGFALAACALLQTLAFAGAISVNGTCELGNCAAPDTLGLTGSSPHRLISFLLSAIRTDSKFKELWSRPD